MKKLTAFIFYLFIAVYAHSQQAEITGTILNPQNEPVEYANVQLLNTDSTFIKGTASDKNGKIRLEVVPSKDYKIIISVLGYDPLKIEVKKIKDKLALGELVLKESAVALDEVTVSANRVIHKIDRQITYPSPIALQTSNNALELLYKMALPRVIVNPNEKSIYLIGNENVKLRINGVDVSVNEIAAIPAKEIIRIDYYDNPGVRVQESAIIDFIVKRRNSGGYIATGLTNSPHIGFGDDLFTFKSNYKNSEWSAFYNLSFRSYKNREKESTTEYNFPENNFIQQTTGIPSSFYYQTHGLNLNYNYTKTDKRVFNITMTGSFLNYRGDDNYTNHYSDRPGIEFPSNILSTDNEKNPVLDFYYKETLSKNQTLFFNIVTGYINTDYMRRYRETDLSGQDAVFNSHVTGKKFSVIGEADHQITWKNLSLYSGINYKLGITKNKYEGTITENVSLNNSEFYLYSQLQGKFSKLSYSLGVGVSYSYFNDQYKGFRYWTFRPSLSLSYPVTDHFYVRYQFLVDQTTPSLSELSDVPQFIDQYRIDNGNPELKPYLIYTNTLQLTFQKNTFQCYGGINHQFYANVIMPDIYLAQSHSQFIQTINNQKHYQVLTPIAGANWEIIKNILSLNLNTQLRWMDSKGNDYRHRYTTIYGNGQINFSLKKWIVNMGICSRNNFLWGETINYGEWWSSFEVGYKQKELYIGATAMNIFTNRWSAGSKNLSKQMPGTSWTYIYDSAPIFGLKLSWNFSWGKQSKAEEKTLQNKDTDNGIRK